MSALTIPHTLRAYRRRALESQANTGSHAWDLKHEAWDAETDCEAYCMDAPDLIPTGFTLWAYKKPSIMASQETA